MSDSNTVELATELTIAWLSNPSTRASAEDVNGFLTAMSDTINSLSSPRIDHAAGEPAPDYTPAVTVRKSLASRDHIISMIDGRPYRTLTRHLSSAGLTPDEYRKRYNLKADYPMVAPGYSDTRRETARRLGLGRKPAPASAQDTAALAQEAAPAAEEPVKPLAKRRSKSAETAAAGADAVPSSTRKPRTRKAKSDGSGDERQGD